MGLLLISLPHFHEEEDIKEVHSTQNQEDETDLGSENLKDVLIVNDRFDDLEVEDDKAKVDQIKAHNQQVVNAVGEFFVSLATIDQEDAAVFVKSAGDPDCERQGDGEIERIGNENWIHDC